MSDTVGRFEADVRARLDRKAGNAEAMKHAILVWDDAAALSQARKMDDLAASGGDLPTLAGVIVSVKANVDVKGWTTNAGSKVLEHEPAATQDAPLIASLREEGAILLAQTNMVEFAFGALGQNYHFGTPFSPVYPGQERLPGGSSSGAAVSVALGLADVAVGTDTSGSVRLPACYCGVSGFKPTQGRYSGQGIFPLSPLLDTAGFLARSIELCDRMDAAVTGRKFIHSAPATMQGKRLAVPTSFVKQNSDPAVYDAFSRAVDALAAAGAEVVSLDMDYLAEAGNLARQGGIVSSEAYVCHLPYIDSRASLYDRRVGPRIAAGVDVRAVDYIKARQALEKLSARYHADAADFDAVLTPTGPGEPPLFSEIADNERYLAINMRVLKFTEFANRINIPSLSLPIGGPDAAIGLMANGRNGQDVGLLALGRAIETTLVRKNSGERRS